MTEIRRLDSIVKKAFVALFIPFGFNSRDLGSQKQVAQAVQVIYNMPITGSGQVLNLTDSFTIYYKGDLILYRIPHLTDFTLVLEGDSGEVNRWKPATSKYQYFIYREGDSRGIRFDSSARQKVVYLSVDSFLAVKAFTTLKVYDAQNDSLIERQKLGDGSILEKYIPKIKYDQSYNDTSYFFFSDKLKDIKFSLSKELDSIKSTKLYKVRLFYNKSDSAPEREFFFELRRIPVGDTKEINNLFEKFRTQSFQ